MTGDKTDIPVSLGVGDVDSTSPRDVKMETLVNSMIKVNSGLINIHYHSSNVEKMDKPQRCVIGKESSSLKKGKSRFKQVKSRLE